LWGWGGNGSQMDGDDSQVYGEIIFGMGLQRGWFLLPCHSSIESSKMVPDTTKDTTSDWHMCFRLAPRSMTLDDLAHICSNFLGIMYYFAFLGFQYTKADARLPLHSCFDCRRDVCQLEMMLRATSHSKLKKANMHLQAEGKAYNEWILCYAW